MSSELEQMTAAGGTISLGGNLFLIKQLSLGDYGQIQAWLRERMPKPFVVVAEALKDLEPLRVFDPDGYAEARKQLLLAAMEDTKSSSGGGASPVMVEQALNSPDGLSFVLWLCIRKSHPEIKYEQIKTWIHDEDLTAIKDKLDDITIFNQPADDEEGEDPANPLSASRPKKKKR